MFRRHRTFLLAAWLVVAVMLSLAATDRLTTRAAASDPVALDATASTPLAGTIDTIAGQLKFGIGGFGGDGGPATAAMLSQPRAVAVDAQGDIYIADTSNQTVRKIDTNGIITSIIANDDAIDADGVAVDSHDNVYVSDGRAVYRIAPGGTPVMFAGGGVTLGDGGPATSALLGAPRALAVDAHDNVYIADESSYRIRKVDTSGTITTVAGNGTQGFSGDGGPATSAQITVPTSVAVDSHGDIVFADVFNRRVREVDTDGMIHTLAGNGQSDSVGSAVGVDGPATATTFDDPRYVAIDAEDNVYVEDGGYFVREIIGGTITTVVGTPLFHGYGDGGPAIDASLNGSSGMAFDTHDDLLMTDVALNVVRKVTRGAGSPSGGAPTTTTPAAVTTTTAKPTSTATPKPTTTPTASTQKPKATAAPKTATQPNATAAVGPRDAVLETTPGGTGFRIQVQFTVPQDMLRPVHGTGRTTHTQRTTAVCDQTVPEGRRQGHPRRT